MLASGDARDDLLADSGAQLASGFLSDPLVEHLEDGERIAFLLSNEKKGIRREADDGATMYAPGDGYRAVAAVTDTRVLFVVGDDAGDDAYSIPYTEIGDVKTARGILTKRLDVWTTGGVCFRFYVRRSAEVTPAAEYVEQAAVVWSRVESQIQSARKRLVDVTEALDADDHESAGAAMNEARTHVEEAKQTASELTTDGTDAIRARIRSVERRLEETDFRIHCARAWALRREGECQWRETEYEAAYDSYEAARTECERALEVAREHDLDAAEIRERIGGITRSLESLSESPLRRAERIHEWAEHAEDVERAATLFEDALAAYRTALVLDWGRDRRFAGDREELRETVVRLAGEIEMTRRTLAERARARGDDHFEGGRYERAHEQYVRARDHLEAALDVVEELTTGSVDDLEDDVTALTAAVDRAERARDERGFAGDTDATD